MFTIHEGEIICKEQYGSMPKNRFYVKPPDQTNIIVLDEEKLGDFANLFTRIFLPQGYPDSVSGDYICYQIWDTAQAFCSTITGILATQEVLRGVGVGDTSATPLAATITWVLKDGCGHLGKILFAYSHGSYLDAYSKKWRLYADTLNDAATCLEMALPAFKHCTALVLCISTVMKAIVGVAGSATRTAMTQHHAIRGNLADVSAKDSAQETAVNLIASIAALLIIALFGNSLTIFLILMVLHIFFNYLAVRAVCLRTLNEPRFLHVIDKYLTHEVIGTPCDTNKNEPVILYYLGTNVLDRNLCGFHIKLGLSMKRMIKRNPKAYYVQNLQEIYNLNEYILVPWLKTRKIFVFLRESATTDDILCAYFHAVLFGILICAINNYKLAIQESPENISRPFPEICNTLKHAEWSREALETPYDRFSYNPSFELMTYLNSIVAKEWPKLREGLRQIGWDLRNHLLIVDEWRICSSKHATEQTSVSETVIPEVLAHVAPKLKTFNSQRDSIVESYGEVNTCVIEPDKQLSDATIDHNINQDQRSNEENLGQAAIPERKIMHEKQDPKTKKKSN